MNRYEFDACPNRIGTGSIKWDLGKRMFAGSEGFIPMWIADTDFATLPQITESVEKRIQHPIFGYASEPTEFYTSMMEWLSKRHGWAVERDWVCGAEGVLGAAAIAINALTAPGDKIAVLMPCYDNLVKAVEQNERSLVQIELLKTDNCFTLDFDALEQAFADGVKMLLFCNPANPLGKVWTQEELTRIAQLLTTYNVLLVSDDIHSDVINSRHKYCPLALAGAEALPNTITCYSPAKVFNLAAVKSAVAIIPDEAIRKRFKAYQERMFQLKLGVFSYETFIAAYTYGETYIDEMNAYVEANANFAVDYIAKNIPQIKTTIPEATFLMLWDCSALGFEGKDLVDFFAKYANVGFSGGYGFGESLGSYVRVNIACSRALLERALEQVKTAVQSR